MAALFDVIDYGIQLSRSEINKLYGSRHIGRDQARGLVGLMDFFCFSEVCSLLYFLSLFLHKSSIVPDQYLWYFVTIG